MNSTHPQALLAFAHQLNRWLWLRVAVQMMTLWFFVWGVLVLALKMAGAQHTEWLTLGIFGFAPIVVLAGLRERRRRPAFEKIRAHYDRLNACGGVIMAQETADMSAWLTQLPAAAVPKFRWHSARALWLLCVSALFAATVLLLRSSCGVTPTHRQVGQSLSMVGNWRRGT